MDSLEKDFEALSKNVRLEILATLREANLRMAVRQIADTLGERSSVVSHHLQILLERQMVSVKESGQWRFYGFETEGFSRMKEFLNDESE